ncbi:polymorphic toxin type 8 domain-containing protein [Paenibacillus sp. NPDC057886]|uniref:polymorphic toxin type 8 domain-containing protein n=1 Tax=Paenibacillus sp. NPDC057886 TaxID=3346270 RepID=UPI0036D18718
MQKKHKFWNKVLSLMIAGSLISTSSLNNTIAWGSPLSEKSTLQESNISDNSLMSNTPKEIASLRSEKSKTFLNENGTYTTQISETPVHYQDSSNHEWKPIDNRLNTTSQTAYNNDHEFKVEMNKKHSTTDDLVEIKEDKFSIGLNPISETNPVKTTQSLSSTKPAGIVTDNVMKYKGLYPDTDLIYTLGNDRLKEELKLTKKPTGKKSVIYSFALTLGNLDYRQEQDGSVSLVNPSTGDTEYIIDKPLMYDSFIPEGYQQVEGVNAYPEEALSYDIHYELKEKKGQLYIDVIPSLAWLNDASRVYPVTIDPTIVKFQPTYRLADTNIRSAFPKQTGATDTTLGVGLYKDATSSNIIRSLIQFDTSTIPQGAKVLTADLNLWLASVSNNTNVDITLNSVNKAWTEYSASWMYADATNLWSKLGGDFNASQVATTSVGPLTSLSANYKWSLPANMLEKWINDPTSNKGFMLKSNSETTNSYKKFISGDDTSNPDYTPLLSVTYTSASRLGLKDYWTYDSHPIANGTSYTNLGTGNNIIQFNDYSLTGRGDTSVDFIRTYNSKSSESSPFGYGWSYTGGETIVEAYKTGSVLFTDHTGSSYEFQYNASSNTYTSSAGEYLTLKKIKNNAGATTGFELTDPHGYLMHFDTISNDDQVSITQSALSYEQDLHGNRITYTRNGNGALTSIKDPSGRTLTFVYSTDGLVDYATLEGRKMDYTYQNGKLVTVDQYSEDGSYSRTQFSYGGNYIKTIFDPNNRLTTYTYDQEFLVKVQEPSTVSVTDASDRPATQYKYDIVARTAEVTNPNGGKTFYTLNSNFVAEKIQDATGEVTQNVLDANYNVTKVTNPDGTTAQQTYDSKGNVLTQTDEVGNVTTYKYNDLNHVVQEIDPKQNITNYTYTAEGDLETIVDAKQKVTRYEYDIYGNLKKTTYPDQSIETYSYDDKGNDIKSVKDAVGNTTTVTTDAVGNIIADTDGNNNLTEYQYDQLNRLKAVIDANRQKTTYTYDTAGNLTQTTNPKQITVQYEYNGQNQLTKKTDATGNATENTFDSNGNLIQTKTPNGHMISSSFTALDQLKTITIDGQQKWAYQYDSNGLLLQVNNGMRSFTYKPDGLPATEVDRGHTKTYTYNANSGLQELAYTTGTVSSKVNYEYTGLDQVKSIAKDNQSLISYQYNDTGAMQQADRANGIITKATYDQGDQLLTYGDYSSAGSALREYNYTYDSNGNVKTIQTDAGSTAYVYDTLDQLTQETLPDGTTIRYSYDEVGNRTQKVVVSSGQEQTTTYSHNSANQLTSVNGQEYQYDNNGNLLNDGKQTYIYDALDQLIEVKNQSGQRIQQYSYDEQGRRIQSIGQSGTTNFFYEGDEVIYETDGNNKTLREYTWDDSGSPVALTKDGQTFYYHLNGHGDVVSLTNVDGNEVARYEYDAWGNIVNQSGSLADENPYRYASYRYNAETGLYYLLSRNYNPQLGFFTSLDSEQDLDLDNPLNRNGYSYGLNNPVAYVDDNGNNPYIIYLIIFVVKVAVKEVVKTGVKKAAKKATVKAIKKGTSSAVAKKTGRSGKQARLKEIANDVKVSTSLRGEIKRDLNEIKRKKRKNVRVPQGYQMQHKRGYEARKGYGYEHSVLNITKNHKTQHRYDNNGKIR